MTNIVNVYFIEREIRFQLLYYTAHCAIMCTFYMLNFMYLSSISCVYNVVLLMWYICCSQYCIKICIYVYICSRLTSKIIAKQKYNTPYACNVI